MDCTAVLAEVDANNRRVSELASEKGLKVGQNVITGVAGFIIPVLWFGMDWQGTQDKEIAALQSRQQYLTVLAEQKTMRRSRTSATVAPLLGRIESRQVSRAGLEVVDA